MDIRPKKRFGQNFLVARWVARIFARWACRFSRLLEIGVGTGFLTSTILSECPEAYVVGVEIDEELSQHLLMLSFYYTGFQPCLADAVQLPLRVEGIEAVYGSIPYNITGPLLSALSIEIRRPALLLLQREVALRIASKPGSEDYGRITVLVQLVYNVRLGRTVPPSAFRPKPKVYSQIVELEPKEDTPPSNVLEAVENVTRCMFSQRKRLAVKVTERCCGHNAARIVAEKYDGLRVFQLPPQAFLEIAMACHRAGE